MPRFKNFEAWIEVDGERLMEHHVGFDPQTHVFSCWIVSEEGKNFAVHVQNVDSPTASLAKCFLDGLWVRSAHITGQDEKIGKKTSWRCARRRLSSSTAQPFCFGTVVLTEDDSTQVEGEQMLQNLGTIKITVGTGTLVPTTPPSSPYIERAVGQGALPEKLAKAFDHRVSFGDAISTTWKPPKRRLERDKEPEVSFIWRYRPRAVLQADGMIPLDNTESDRLSTASEDSGDASFPAGTSSTIEDNSDELSETDGTHGEAGLGDTDNENDGATDDEEFQIAVKQRMTKLKIDLAALKGLSGSTRSKKASDDKVPKRGKRPAAGGGRQRSAKRVKRENRD